MSFYVLNDDFQREIQLEDYESLIWTERFAEAGDIELHVSSTVANRQLYVAGVHLGIDQSNRVMVIETIEDDTDEEGRAMLKVTGPSLENLLDQRIAMGTFAVTTEAPNWVLTGKPGDIARSIFQQICVDGILDHKDIIPFISTGSLYSTGTIPEPEDVVTIEVSPSTVYSAIKSICDANYLGFRLVKGPDDGNLYFDIYAGNNRTSAQSVLPAVIFSPGLDNLDKVSELRSIATYKNVAYVFSATGRQVVYSNEVSNTISGFARRVLYVNVDSGILTGTPLSNFLQQKGQEALAAARPVEAFDGETPQNGKYKYDLDYNLGDLIELQNIDGVAKNMRVTEQIFVSDAEGDRAYPTLTDVLYITPGSWYAWDASEVWDDAEGTWDDA